MELGLAVLGGLILLAIIYLAFLRPRAKEIAATREAPRITEKSAAEQAAADKGQAGTAEGRRPSPAPPPKGPPSKGPPTPAPPAVSPTEGVAPEVGAPEVTGAPFVEEAPVPSKRDVAGVRKGLTASRGGFIARLRGLFAGKREIDPSILSAMEEVLLTSDVGVKTTAAILERLREGLERNELTDEDAVWSALRKEALRILDLPSGGLRLRSKPTVALMVGVNGVGKTTTIGKLATRYAKDGKKVVLAAGDTFRAAAVQQLEVWGQRIGVDVVKGKEGGDPGAVAFEATQKAKDGGLDLLLVDTAGRLHTKAPLMDEIKKVRKTIGKAMEGAPHETLLVLDATTGQNALTQATMFKDAVDLTGIVLTKLDGTAKGGIVLAICDELKVPVRYIGLGERAEDLREFHADEFVEALFGKEGETPGA